MLQIIITILVYSLILTIVNLYKDSSGYYMVETLDIIIAGPVCWVLCLILLLLKPIVKPLMKKRKVKSYSPKSKKYIERVVSKVVKNYRKHSRYDDEELFDFSFKQGEFNCNDIEGWGRLLVNRPLYEQLNRKFERLMYNQKDDTLAELIKYFDVVTREMLEATGDYNQYFIDDTMRRNHPTYKLKAS